MYKVKRFSQVTKESREFARKDYEGLSQEAQDQLRAKRSEIAKDLNAKRNEANRAMQSQMRNNNALWGQVGQDAGNADRLKMENNLARTKRDVSHITSGTAAHSKAATARLQAERVTKGPLQLGNSSKSITPPPPSTSKLSKGGKIGLALAGTAAVGGLMYGAGKLMNKDK